MRGLSLGGQVSYAHTWTKTYYSDLSTSTPTTFSLTSTTDTFGAGPRVGYDIRAGKAVSVWPRLALLYGDAGSSTTPAGANGSTKVHTFDVQFFGPVLWHAAPHFFVGLGPFLQMDAAASETVDGRSVPAEKVTTFGVKLALGGWL